MFEGFFKDDQLCGEGELRDGLGNLIYIGSYLDNLKHGGGIEYY